MESIVLLSSHAESSPQAIQQDLKRCSQAVGILAGSLASARNDIRRISEIVSHSLSAIWLMIPTTFSAAHKNPCWKPGVTLFEGHEWKSNNGTVALLCLPYSFLAGFPKSGTTTVHRALRKHPEITLPRLKEFHWWTRKMSNCNKPNTSNCVQKYLNWLYEPSQEISSNTGHVTLDGSQSTLWDSSFYSNHQDYCATPAIISRVLPDAKFIVVMRNPIARLYSHFFQGCTRSNSKGIGHNVSAWPKVVQENPAAHFHNVLVSDLEYFNGCLRERSLFECVSENRFRGDECGGVGYRITVSIYYIHLLKWLQFYPKEHFLFLRMEDMSINPQEFMNNITDFLEITPVSEGTAVKLLSKETNVQKLQELDPFTELQMKDKSKELLKEFYKPYNILLADLIGDNKFLWND